MQLGTFRPFSYSYQVGHATVKVIGELTVAIRDAMVEEVLPVPTLEDQRSIAPRFQEWWNFHHSLGPPDNFGTQFFNYKKTHSIVLLTAIDANCVFRVVLTPVSLRSTIINLP